MIYIQIRNSIIMSAIGRQKFAPVISALPPSMVVESGHSLISRICVIVKKNLFIIALNLLKIE